MLKLNYAIIMEVPRLCKIIVVPKYIFVAPYLQSEESCALCPSWAEGYTQKIYIFYFQIK
jgi:hypothetical protein